MAFKGLTTFQRLSKSDTFDVLYTPVTPYNEKKSLGLFLLPIETSRRCKWNEMSYCQTSLKVKKLFLRGSRACRPAVLGSTKTALKFR